MLISGSLRQRRWRQRPRSTPALLHHSSLDRYDGLTAFHSITAEAIVSISATVLYCVRVCVHVSAETNQSCFLPFSPPLSSEPTLRGHDIGPELCFTLRSILSLSLSLLPPSHLLTTDSLVLFATGTVTAAGLVEAPIMAPLLNYQADLKAPPSP